jgi:cellulose synthase/poly-beta-1,6-N-acetylglucosamine synthase-like glycosyltransferase
VDGQSALPVRRLVRELTGEIVGTLVCLIPAHNEAESIVDTLRSVAEQTLPPDRIVVVADNCTDETERIAAEYATVLPTVGNRDKKAGALNQALDALMPELADDDCVLVMDADTTIAAEFAEAAQRMLAENPRIGGVSSTFVGREPENLLGLMQAMEYFRYRRQVRRNGERAFVLSGTASVIRVGALRAIKAERGRRLPFGGGGYYDTASLTEDNELTFALLLLGYQCVAPGLISTTDIMPAVGKLYRQRHRWYLGALRNLREYGRRMPWHMRIIYWRQQVGLALSILVLTAFLLLLAFLPDRTAYLFGAWSVPALLLLALERVVSVWPMGWRARIVAATVLPEQVYSWLLTFTFGAALKDFVLGRKGAWHAT